VNVSDATLAAPRFDVILGRCDDMRAEVYVRAAGLPAGSAATITGTLSGPRSRFAITLPTTASFTDLGPAPDGRSAVARAILTEPAYWSPELPHRYRVQARVAGDAGPLATLDRMVGLRRLGVRGRSFWLEGRRWVARGVACAPSTFAPQVLRDLLAAAVLDDPDDATCAVADEVGVGIIARCGADPVAALERVSGHPSVLLAVLPIGSDAAAVLEGVQQGKGTMLLGVAADGTAPPGPVADGVDCVVVVLPESAVPHPAWRDPWPTLPLVAARRTSGGIAERRHACDQLQADLAAWRQAAAADQDWAGYLAW